MKIILIDPPGWQKHSWSLGLAYLAGALARADFQVQILDLNNHIYSDAQINQIIAGYAPQVIGVSVKTATANASAQIIKNLKNIFPHIIFVAGGPHITLCAQEFLEENPQIDLGIMGEAEESLVELAQRIRAGKQDVSGISGICYRVNGRVAAEEVYKIPDVARLNYPIFDFILGMNFTDFRYPLLTSRGCPHACIFCCAGLIAGKKWRARTPEDIVQELTWASDRYQSHSFEIMDDNFTLDIKRAKQFCRLLIKQKMKLDWWCHNGLRADRLDQELLNLMKQAGCQSVALGVESGDRAVFDNLNKGEGLLDIVRAVKMIKQARMRCVGYFIIGLPGDSLESTKKTVRFQKGLELSDHKYNMLIPYPGTKIWDLVQKKGRLLTDIKGAYHFGEHLKVPFETDELDRQTLQECMYLAENQEWLSLEDELGGIQENFISRFARPPQKIAFIGDGAPAAAKNIEIVLPGTRVLSIQTAGIPGQGIGGYRLESDAEGSYFNALFALMQQGDGLVLDLSAKKLYRQQKKAPEMEYVHQELLAEPARWDRSAKKYVATRLSRHSPDTCSAKNGIIYKDGVALPFSHCPQFEKMPCGKIESGLAFISNSAFSFQSTYTADYLTQKENLVVEELIMRPGGLPMMEKIAAETDILFYPQELQKWPLAFYPAKINIGYSRHAERIILSPKGFPDYRRRTKQSIFSRRIRQLAVFKRSTKEFLVRPLTVAVKIGRVLFLWTQIVFLWPWSKIKGGFGGSHKK